MKKALTFILTALLLVGTLMSLPYYKKCKGCQTEYSKKHGCTLPANAWRDFSVPIKEIDGKRYVTYRCCYGHVFLVEI